MEQENLETMIKAIYEMLNVDKIKKATVKATERELNRIVEEIPLRKCSCCKSKRQLDQFIYKQNGELMKTCVKCSANYKKRKPLKDISTQDNVDEK